MTYDEAMERFGHDAPDLRFGMELIDLTDLAKTAEFRVFRATADSGGRVRGVNAKGAAAPLFAQRHRLAHRASRAELRRQRAGVVQGRRRAASSPRRSPRIFPKRCWLKSPNA